MKPTLRKRLAKLARQLADRLDPPETPVRPPYSEAEIINDRLAVWNYPVQLPHESTLLKRDARLLTKD